MGALPLSQPTLTAPPFRESPRYPDISVVYICCPLLHLIFPSDFRKTNGWETAFFDHTEAGYVAHSEAGYLDSTETGYAVYRIYNRCLSVQAT